MTCNLLQARPRPLALSAVRGLAVCTSTVRASVGATGPEIVVQNVRRGVLVGAMGWRAALAALFALLCAAGVGGAGLEIGEMVHTSRDAGANEWWDAV
jgi:hypothetical protein